MELTDLYPVKPGERYIEWFSRVMRDPEFLEAQGRRAQQQLWDAGLPVCGADKKGVYLLYKDGRKEYTKLYSDANKSNNAQD